MKILALIFVLLAAIPVISQSKTNELISTAGNTNQGTSAIVSWSLGEVVVSTTQIHQGYQFPYETSDLTTAIEDHFGSEIKIFPNPTTNILSITLTSPLELMEIKLLNMKGQELETNVQTNADQIQIDFSSVKSGIYFLHISQKSKKSKSFKIIKHDQ